MDLSTIIQLALFVPFFVMLAIFTISYVINGYRKDFGRSLISFLATILAIIIALLLSKGGAWVISTNLLSMVPATMLDLFAGFGTLFTDVAKGIIGVLVSFVLFGLAFVISMSIMKSIGKNMRLGKLEKLSAGNAGTRALAMVVRAADAVLVTIMLLLPLYGALAMFAPPAAALMRMSETLSASQQQENIPLYEEEYLEPESAVPVSVDYSDATVQYAKTCHLVDKEDSAFASPVPQPLGTQSVIQKVDGSVPYEEEILPEQFDDENINAAVPQQGNMLPQQLVGTEVDLAEILSEVSNHPILTPYKYGPGAWVNTGLSSFSMNGSTVNVNAAVGSLEGLLERVNVCWEAFEAEDSQGAIDATKELIDYTRKEVVHQQWSYDIAMALVGEMDDIINMNADRLSGEEDLLELYDQIRPLLDMSYEDYTRNAEEILEVAAWFVETYGKYDVNALSYEEAEILEKEMNVRLGNLLNSSEQAVGVKRIMLQMFAQKMFDTLPDATDPAYADYYAARKDVPNSATAFVNKYFGDGFVPEEDRLTEINVLLSLLGYADAFDTAEAFVHHPLFGADAVLEAMDEQLYIRGSVEDFGDQLAKSERVNEACERLDNILKSYDDKPFEEYLSFGDEVYSYLLNEIGLQDVAMMEYQNSIESETVASEQVDETHTDSSVVVQF